MILGVAPGVPCASAEAQVKGGGIREGWVRVIG